MVFVRDHTRSRYETNEFGFFVGYTIVDIWGCTSVVPEEELATHPERTASSISFGRSECRTTKEREAVPFSTQAKRDVGQHAVWGHHWHGYSYYEQHYPKASLHAT